MRGKRLRLSNGTFVRVSRIDHDYLRQYRWTRWGRAVPFNRAAGGYLGRVIAARMGLRVPKGHRVVLRDHDPRNFTRANLIVVRRPSEAPRDRRKGVTKYRGRWRTTAMVNRKHALCKSFSSRSKAWKVRREFLRQAGA